MGLGGELLELELELVLELLTLRVFRLGAIAGRDITGVCVCVVGMRMNRLREIEECAESLFE